MAEEKIFFFSFRFSDNRQNGISTFFAFSALENGLKSLNKVLIGLSCWESLLSDLNGLKNAKISYLCQQIYLINFLGQFLLIRFDTSDKMIGSRRQLPY